MQYRRNHFKYIDEANLPKYKYEVWIIPEFELNTIIINYVFFKKCAKKALYNEVYNILKF